MSILAIVLCTAVVIAAICADRSARSNHRFRAIGLNLCGIACLALGFVTILTWSSKSGVIVTRQIAAADAVGSLAGDRFVYQSNPQDDRTPESSSHEKPLDGTPLDGTPLDGTPLDGTPLDGTPLDGTPLDGTPLDGTPLDGDRDPQDAPDNGASPDQATPDSATPDSATPDSATRDSATPEGETALEVETFTPSLNELIDLASRPQWVEQADVEVGPIHQYCVTSNEVHMKATEARADLYHQLKLKTDEYINQLIGNPRASRWIGLPESRIRDRLVAPDHIYDELVRSTVSTMHQSHALLQFDPGFRNEMEGQWRDVVARARLVKMAVVAGVVLGMLALIFGYFNADTATRGFYTRRLKFGTFVAILGLVALGVLLARSMPWIWL